MLQIENDKLEDIYVGSDKIKEVYYGSEKVWGEIEPIQGGYWVHKDTGVITYFGLEDPSITDGIMSSPSWRNNCSEVQLPSGITGLGGGCFGGTMSLISITLPESVTSLGPSCFESCIFLTSITIPEGVTSIGQFCFNNCSFLTLATVLPATPPSLGRSVFDRVHESFNIKVRSPYVNAYKIATNWISYASKISAI